MQVAPTNIFICQIGDHRNVESLMLGGQWRRINQIRSDSRRTSRLPTRQKPSSLDSRRNVQTDRCIRHEFSSFLVSGSPISASGLGQMSLFTRWVSLTGHWLGGTRKARVNFAPRPRGQVFMALAEAFSDHRGQWNSDLVADERGFRNFVGETSDGRIKNWSTLLFVVLIKKTI